MLEAALPLLPPQITHLGATVSPDNSYSLHNAQASGFVIRCRREMYGGYDRYLLEKQLPHVEDSTNAEPDALRRTEPITKADLCAAGYSGGTDSAARRAALLKTLRLPEHMSSNALLDALNVLMTREDFLCNYGEHNG